MLKLKKRSKFKWSVSIFSKPGRQQETTPATRKVIFSLSSVPMQVTPLTNSGGADIPLRRHIKSMPRQARKTFSTKSRLTPSTLPKTPSCVASNDQEHRPQRLPLFRVPCCPLLENYNLGHNFLCCFSRNPHRIPATQYGRHSTMEYNSFIRCVLKIKTI